MMIRLKNTIVFIVFLLLVCSLGFIAWGQESSTGKHSEQISEEIVDTFVLTPIRINHFDMEIPAYVLGPRTNNSCRDWTGRTESCYLPACVLSKTESSKWPQLLSVIKRHLSGMLDCWKTGSWPAEGGSISYSLKQYASISHLWLTTRLDIEETLGWCWLGGDDDPQKTIFSAETQPAAEIRIEVFDGTRNAKGYPSKKCL